MVKHFTYYNLRSAQAPPTAQATCYLFYQINVKLIFAEWMGTDFHISTILSALLRSPSHFGISHEVSEILPSPSFSKSHILSPLPMNKIAVDRNLFSSLTLSGNIGSLRRPFKRSAAFGGPWLSQTGNAPSIPISSKITNTSKIDSKTPIPIVTLESFWA